MLYNTNKVLKLNKLHTFHIIIIIAMLTTLLYALLGGDRTTSFYLAGWWLETTIQQGVKSRPAMTQQGVMKYTTE